MEMNFDVAIIGGGPAGTSAAITAARAGAKVLLIEKDAAIVNSRHRVCGEFISPEATILLGQLLGSDLSKEPYPRIKRARIFGAKPGTRANVVCFDREAISVSRADLDARLWKSASIEPNVTVMNGCEILSIEQDATAFRIVSSEREFHSTFVINATGKWSRLGSRKDQLPENVEDRWIGLKAHFYVGEHLNPNDFDSTDLYLVPGGYCGVQHVSGDVVNVAALVRSSTAKSLESVFGMNAALAERSQGWRPIFQPISTAPVFFAPAKPTYEGLLNCGDAAGFVDPFSGDGIALALRSGALGAQVVCEALASGSSRAAARDYADRHSREFGAVYRNTAFFRRALLPSGELRFPFALVMRMPAVASLAFRLTRG